MKGNQEKDRSKGFLGTIERVGNALPHPAILFVIFCAIVIVISQIGAMQGWSVDYYDAKQKEQVTANALSLMNAEGLRYMFNSATTNFTSFAPLGTVLVAMLGVGVAEWSGLINSALKKLINSVPKGLLTAVIVFAGILSNIASDAGYVVVVPLGAIVFAGAGRHPIAGLAAAFAGVSAGFSANLLLGTLDPLLAGITNEALRAGGIDYVVEVTDNMFFMQASTFILTIAGTLVTEKIVEPRLGKYTGSYRPNQEPLSDIELKGLRNAGIALLVYVVIMGVLMFGGPLALFKEIDADGVLNLKTFLRSGLLLGILLLFMIPGVAYGKTIGKIKNSNDLVSGMTDAMKSMAGYLVLAFFAAQFINYFNRTNLGLIVSYKGATLLESIGFVGMPLVIAFVIVSGFLNLFIGSASAKWAIMAPIFVPMLYGTGIAPEFTQLAYRIGDSSTNIITPLMSYFAMIVVFAQRYDENSGIGTVIATMIPYSIIFLIIWVVLLLVFAFFSLPIGPAGASMMISML
ncbi:MAG: AbgT family transporter [Peptoniphilaceae bacterium]